MDYRNGNEPSKMLLSLVRTLIEKEVIQAIMRQTPGLIRIHMTTECEMRKKILAGYIYKKYIINERKEYALSTEERKQLGKIASLNEAAAVIHLRTFLEKKNFFRVIDDIVRDYNYAVSSIKQITANAQNFKG